MFLASLIHQAVARRDAVATLIASIHCLVLLRKIIPLRSRIGVGCWRWRRGAESACDGMTTT